MSFSINGKETQVSVSVSVDNTTTLVADKIASKLTETMTEYEVSKDASTITLIRKFGGSVTPSLFSASTTGVVCTITDSSKRESRNIITKDIINKSNTIYEIRYDFDLNSETIELQKGCTLKFNGGSLANGKIVGTQTLIEANATCIFGNSFSLEGTFENSIAYHEWFKLTSDIDDTNSIQKVLNLFHSICFLNKTYIVSSTLNTNNAYILKGSSNKYGKSVIRYIGDSTLFNLTSPQSLNYIIFENIALEGYAKEDGYVFSKNSICISQKEPVSFEIKNVLIEGFEYGIKAEVQTYYNYIETSRFNNVKYCLCDFNANNFKIVGVRASYFHTFISLISGDGPLVIENGCFEVFNGYIVRSKYELRPEVIFSKNYVETYGDRKLPLGYADNDEIYFGNSSLFIGIFGALSLLDNMFQINDSSYLVYSRLMNAFTCIRNGFYIDKENTNLERIYHIEKVYTVNIENFYSKLSTKNYNKKLKEPIIDGFNMYNFKIYDSIFDKKYNKYLGVPALAEGVSSLDTNAIRHWSDGRDLIFKGILIKGSTNNLIDLSSYTLNIPNNLTFHVVDSNNNIIPLTLDKSSKVLSIANNNIDNLGNLIFDNFRIPLMEFN